MYYAKRNAASGIALFFVTVWLLGSPNQSHGQDIPTPTVTAVAGDGQVTLTWGEVQSTDRVTSWRYGVKEGRNPYDWNEIPGSNRNTTTYTVTGLTNGISYRFKVQARDGTETGASSNTVSATPGQGQEFPTPTLSALAGDEQVTLTWSEAGATDRILSWRYGVKEGRQSYVWNDVPDSDRNTTSYIVTDLTNGTSYRFKVRAQDGNNLGPSSDTAFATPGPPPGDAPGAVTGLGASGGVGEVTLSWTNPSGTVTSNEIRYAAAGESLPETWTDIGVATSYTVGSLTDCTEYTFEVRAENATGAGPSESVTETPGDAPGAVTGLGATAGVGEVALTWTNPSGTVTSNEIRYAAAGESLPETWTDIGVATSYTVGSLTDCTEYTFEVRATNSCDDGGSDSVTETPGDAPGAVTGLGATAGVGEVALTWTNPSGTVTSNEIRYAAAGESLPETWTDIGVATSYTVGSLTDCTEYTFEVRAVNGCGDGGSDSVTETPGDAPGVVAGLGASGGVGEVTLSWTNPSGTVTSNEIRYAAAGESLPETWTDIGVATSYTAGSLTDCTEYTFEVRAINGCGDGGSDSVTETPGSAPGVVAGLGASGGVGEVTLSWTNPSGTVTSNEIRYAAAGESLPETWTDIGVATSYTVGSLTDCTEYTFEVRAINGCGDGGSDSVTETPGSAPGVVAGLGASGGVGEVTLSWTNPGGTVTSNEIRYAAAGESLPETWTDIGVATSYTVGSLTDCTEYTFEVRAINGCGDGGSDSVTETPGSAPGVVAGLGASGGVGEVTLSWTNPGGTVTSNEIRYAAAGESLPETWTDIGVATSYTVGSLTDCTEYTFEVRAINGCGDGGSDSVTETPGSAPGVVAGLGASGGVGEVTLSWTNPGGTVTSNEIRYAAAGESLPETWTDIGVATSYTVGSLTDCTEYTFEVRAINGCGDGGSDSVTETPGSAPGVVAGLGASGGVGEVTLSWTNPGGTVTSNEIRYAAAGESLPETWTDIGVATSYTVGSLTDCTEYTFEVRAINGCGDGGSDSVTETPGSAPGVVTGLGASGGVGEVTLSWTNPSGTITNNQVRYAKEGTDINTKSWTDIGVLTSHTVGGLDDCAEYTFEVRAVNGCGDGGSDSVTETPTAGSTAGPVSGLTVAAVRASAVDLSWTNPAGVTKVEIRHAQKGAAWSSWSNVGVVTSYTVSGVDTYCNGYNFEVRAYVCGGDGSSSTMTQATGSAPGPVRNLSATAGNRSVTLNWDAPNTGGTVGIYKIRIGDITKTTTGTSITVSNLTNCAEYTFTVLANNCIDDGPSRSEDATPTAGSTAGPVSGLGVAAVRASAVDLSWTNPAGVTKVEIRHAQKGAAWSSWSNVGVVTSYTVSGVDTYCNGYNFEVRAYVCGGGGGSSSTMTQATGSAPGPVRNLSETAGNRSVTLNWDAPNTGGTVGIYKIRIGDITKTTTGTSITVSNLTNCAEYTFTVLANNCIDDGPSRSEDATPTAGSTAGPVSGLTVAVRASAVDLSWTNPAGVTKVEIRHAQKGAAWSSWSNVGVVTSYTVSGVDTYCNGYNFEVRAYVCGGGGGSSSTMTQATGSAPGPVRNLSETAGNRSVTLNWDAPNTGGTVGIYKIRIGDITKTTTGTSITVSNLTNCAEYTFTVLANNCIDDGPSRSEDATPTAGSTAGPVSGLTVAVRASAVDLSWTNPAGVTKVEIRHAQKGAAWSSWSNVGVVTSYTVSGLDTYCNGYNFEVRAYVCGGDGGSSSTMTQATGSAPGPVRNLSATAGNRSVTLNWDAPNTGGTVGIYKIRIGDITKTTTGTSITVSNLTNCAEYTFTVLANNCIDDGPSRSEDATPTAGSTAGPVSGLTVAAVRASAVDLSWTNPAGVTKVEIRHAQKGAAWSSWSNVGVVTSYTVSGLDTYCNGYNFEVRAYVCGGDGSSSTMTQATGSAPGAVTNLGARREGSGNISLTWTNPGGPITESQIRYAKTSTLLPTTWTDIGVKTSYKVTGLTNCAEYTFQVRAKNCRGEGGPDSDTETPAAYLSVASISKVAASRNEFITAIQVSPSGGCTPYTYSLSANASAAGLSISSGGKISGDPPTLGSWTITVSVTDANSSTVSKSFKIVVAEPLVIGPIHEFSGQVGLYFSEGPLDVSGGQTPYSYSLSGAPTGLEITSSGVIQGTPTADGYFDVTLTVTDNDGRTESHLFGIDIPLDGDFNGDGTRDASDAALFKKKSGLRSSDSGFDSRMDLNGDGTINFADLVILSGYIQRDASSQSNSESDDDSE